MIIISHVDQGLNHTPLSYHLSAHGQTRSRVVVGSIYHVLGTQRYEPKTLLSDIPSSLFSEWQNLSQKNTIFSLKIPIINQSQSSLPGSLHLYDVARLREWIPTSAVLSVKSQSVIVITQSIGSFWKPESSASSSKQSFLISRSRARNSGFRISSVVSSRSPRLK